MPRSGATCRSRASGDEKYLAVAPPCCAPAAQRRKFRSPSSAADQPASEPRAAQRSNGLSTAAAGTSTCQAGHRRPEASTRWRRRERSRYSKRDANQAGGCPQAMTTAPGRKGLQRGTGEGWRFSDDDWLSRRSLADQIPDHHQPSAIPTALEAWRIGAFQKELKEWTTSSPARTARRIVSCACGYPKKTSTRAIISRQKPSKLHDGNQRRGRWYCAG